MAASPALLDSKIRDDVAGLCSNLDTSLALDAPDDGKIESTSEPAKKMKPKKKKTNNSSHEEKTVESEGHGEFGLGLFASQEQLAAATKGSPEAAIALTLSIAKRVTTYGYNKFAQSPSGISWFEKGYHANLVEARINPSAPPRDSGPLECPADVDALEWANSSGIKIKMPNDSEPIQRQGMDHQFCVLGFGGAPWTLVIGRSHIRAHLRAHPLFDANYGTLPLPLPFDLVEIPRRGIGMVANRDIQLGELIAEEQPLVVAPKETPLDIAWNFSKFLQEDMHPANVPVFDSLANCKVMKEGMSLRHCIFRTNAWRINFPFVDDHYSAVYEHLSRANHSCRPHAAYEFTFYSFRGAFTAVRPIKAGEEITTSYLGPDPWKMMSKSARRKKLKEDYGFFCMCEECSNR